MSCANSSLSLTSSLNTCKVIDGYAANLASDRFLNPNNAVCIPWNGVDNAGRSVCADSFVTKRAGCNSAWDRVQVENAQRPYYSSYVTTDISTGLKGGCECNCFNQVTGSFNNSLSGNLNGNGSTCAYTPCNTGCGSQTHAQQASLNYAPNVYNAAMAGYGHGNSS